MPEPMYHVSDERAVLSASRKHLDLVPDLDPLAREPLWQAGLDFDHGTGHGVGSYLSVHEGPQRISKLGTTPLETGMILSNEPGFYREGQYGIRLENLVLVRPAEKIDGGRGPEKILISPGPCTPHEAGVSNGVVDRFAGRVPILGGRLGSG